MLSAVDENDEEIVEMLLKLPDIDVNKTGCSGWTPLLLAIAEKNEIIVELLLKHPDIDVNKAGLKGWTPLTRACNRGDWAPMVDLDFDSYRHEPENWPILQRLLNHPDVNLDLPRRPHTGWKKILGGPTTPAGIARQNNLSFEKIELGEVRQMRY